MNIRNAGILFAAAMLVSTAHNAAGQTFGVPGMQIDAFQSLDAASQRIVLAHEPLTGAAHLIGAQIEQNWDATQGGSGGYASIALAENAVILRWKGELPANLRQSLKQARKIAPVRVEAARYSRIELKAAARRIGEFIESRSKNGQPYHAVYVADDRKIKVAVSPGTDRTYAANTLPSVDVPVEIIEEAPAAAISRYDSWAPWKGGAYFVSLRAGSSAGRGICTSGFGVFYGGYEYILTAAHCGTWPDYFVDGTKEYIGYANAEDWRLDLLLVGPVNANHQIYWGDDSYPGWVVNVGRWDWVWSNDWLCQSGYTSARITGSTVCNLRAANLWAERVWICDSDGDCFWINDLVAADKIGGDGIAGRGGDSGGPVVTVDSDGRVVAKGISVACYPSVARCNRLLFQDFGTAQRQFPGLQPLTGW